MKKVLKEQCDAFGAFSLFCKKNADAWNNLQAFGNAVAKFNLKTEEILKVQSEQEENNKGITKTKLAAKKNMASEAVSVAESLQAYSLVVGDKNLFGSMSITYTQIMRAKDVEAISTSTLVMDTVNKLPADALLPFGITDETKTLLGDLISDYYKSAPTTRNVITNKTVLTKKLTVLVNEANFIMRKELLKMARQIKKTNPNFYDGLVANAIVIKNAVHSKIRLTILSDVTQGALKNARVVIDGTDIKGFTDAKGKLTLSRVPEGKRNVIITLANYTTMVLEAVDFKCGHSITRTVDLSPAFVVPAKEKVAP